MTGSCDSCGEGADELLAVGTVVDYAFRPDYRFCRACYDRYEGRHDELHPKAVAEQQAWLDGTLVPNARGEWRIGAEL